MRFFSLVERSDQILLGNVQNGFIIPFPGTTTFVKIPLFSPKNSKNFVRKKWKSGDLVRYQMRNNSAEILGLFDTRDKNSAIESMIFLQNIPTEWNESVKKQEKICKNADNNWKNTFQKIPEHLWFSLYQNVDFSTKVNWEKPFFSRVENSDEWRVSFENWYTMTIDGADAKDLDDAISLAMDTDGGIILAVHIADVSSYVAEKSPIDREAFLRGTSVYLPDRVIPMLPETLSDDLCSLNPYTQKRTLSVVMKLDRKTGKVLRSDVLKSVIFSRHRGIYEDIFEKFQTKNYEDSCQKHSIELAFELFEILKKRRKKEGKIHFETTELFFDLDDKKIFAENIKKRERNDAHRLIEEFMVLANEEVAKWCVKRKIPFLSRLHTPPSEEAEATIYEIMGKKSQNPLPITPKEIADFLGALSEDEHFFASKMILPKMSKASYSDTQMGHFGLALSHYAHFTSPIRRYSDLVTHRMIHKYYEKSLPKNAFLSEKIPFLHRAAEMATMTERRAENMERAAHKVYILDFMQRHIGEIFSGKVSGIVAWGFFVELENGVEVTVFFPKSVRVTADLAEGILTNSQGKILARVGEKKCVKITKILKQESRIVAEVIKEVEK